MTTRKLPALPPINNADTSVATVNNASSLTVGTYTVASDTFTPMLDLNDGATFRIHPQGLKILQPEKTVVRAGSVRAPGALVPRWQYKNQHIQVEISLRGSTVPQLLASIGKLLAAIETPPYCLRLAFPGGTQYNYADVVAVVHDIPSDTQLILTKAITRIHIDFECLPGLRDTRRYVQNLCTNPGFEAPSQPGVPVFADTFATTNAYRIDQGSLSVPLTANVMTIQPGMRLAFGSPALGAINTWQIRWQYLTGAIVRFYLHYVSQDNNLFVQYNGGAPQLAIFHRIAGLANQLAAATPALVNNNWYWLTVTQYPTAAGFPAAIQMTLNNDNAGAVGTLVQALGPVATTDGVTALVGQPMLENAINSPTNVLVGGAFPNVHTLSTFGPGGWGITNLADSTGNGSGAWEQNTANTLPVAGSTSSGQTGPVTSLGAARIDLPPAGIASICWRRAVPSPLIASTTCPLAKPGNTLGAKVRYTTQGLSSTAVVSIVMAEYDLSGNLLRVGTAVSGSRTGASSGVWALLSSNSYVTGFSTAFVDVELTVKDPVAGASAGGIVWFDNVQCWDVTRTGMSDMAYAETTFECGPAQLLVSGLLGDLPVPAHTALGTFQAAFNHGQAINYVLGRRPIATDLWQILGASVGWYGSSPPNPQVQMTPILDGTSYGGYYLQANMDSSGHGMQALFTSPHPASVLGTYQLWARIRTAEVIGNIGNIQTRAKVNTQRDSWFTAGSLINLIDQAYGQFGKPVTASNAWTLANIGQTALPGFLQAPLAAATQNYVVPFVQFINNTNDAANGSINWQCLFPIDGVVCSGAMNNPSNSTLDFANTWVWIYLDGLGMPTASGQQPATNPYAWSYSLESTGVANPGNSSGGPGTPASGPPNVNAAADPFMVLDPTIDVGNDATQKGFNQFAVLLANTAGTVTSMMVEFQYSPRYLYPR